MKLELNVPYITRNGLQVYLVSFDGTYFGQIYQPSHHPVPMFWDIYGINASSSEFDIVGMWTEK